MVRRLHQYTQSQKRFEALFAEGLSILGTPDTYEAASEKLLQAVREAPLVWTKHRFYAFALAIWKTFRSLDIDAITKDFIENENEPAHFRVLAAFCAGAHYTEAGSHMNMNTAAEFLRQGLDIIAATSLSEVDAKRQVLHPPYQRFSLAGNDMIPPSDLSLKTVLRYMKQKIRKQLTSFTKMKESANLVPTVELTRLHQRSCAGGLICDCCGMTLKELQMTSYMRCDRCEMVFYCSKECQREHWKNQGHKQICRKKGLVMTCKFTTQWTRCLHMSK